MVAFSGALLVAAMAGLVALALGLLTRALTPLPLRDAGLPWRPLEPGVGLARPPRHPLA